jgi:hypothetical protein
MEVCRPARRLRRRCSSSGASWSSPVCRLGQRGWDSCLGVRVASAEWLRHAGEPGVCFAMAIGNTNERTANTRLITSGILNPLWFRFVF